MNWWRRTAILCAMVSIPAIQQKATRYALEETVVLLLIFWLMLSAGLICALVVVILGEVASLCLHRVAASLPRLPVITRSDATAENGNRSAVPTPLRT
jgi:hypothetical protein